MPSGTPTGIGGRVLRVEPICGAGQRVTVGLDGPLSWLPFQHVLLSAGGRDRPALFLAPPGEPGRTELCLLGPSGSGEIEAGGAPGLTAGTAIRVHGPFGNGLDPGRMRGRELLLIATGQGIASMWGCLSWAVASGEPRGRVTVVAGARTPADLVYREELESLALQERIDLRMAVEVAGPGWTGPCGVLPVLFRGLRLDPPATTAVLAGPERILKFAVLELLMRGVHEHAIFVVPEIGMRCIPDLCSACPAGQAYVCAQGPVFAWTQVREMPEQYF